MRRIIKRTVTIMTTSWTIQWYDEAGHVAPQPTADCPPEGLIVMMASPKPTALPAGPAADVPAKEDKTSSELKAAE
jgi:hypothetical protein